MNEWGERRKATENHYNDYDDEEAISEHPFSTSFVLYPYQRVCVGVFIKIHSGRGFSAPIFLFLVD